LRGELGALGIIEHLLAFDDGLEASKGKRGIGEHVGCGVAAGAGGTNFDVAAADFGAVESECGLGISFVLVSVDTQREKERGGEGIEWLRIVMKQ